MERGKDQNLMILIVGAASRVGRVLEAALERRFPDRVVAATREEIDLTDPDRVNLEMERLDPRPTVAINCAAITDPVRAERAPQEALLTNREGVACLSRACREIGCRLVHFSTVEVFDGRKRSPYVEEDPPAASSQYGRIRHLGELAVAEGNPEHLILRLSLLCGDGAHGDPLVRIRNTVSEGAGLAWDERRVSPIFAEDLGSILPTLLLSDWRGVLHLANAGSCFLSELAAETASWMRKGARPELLGGPGPASFRESSGPNAVLDAGRFARLSGRHLRGWKEALAATLHPAGES